MIILFNKKFSSIKNLVQYIINLKINITIIIFNF